MGEIDERAVYYMGQKLGLTLDNEDLFIKSNWLQYKKFIIFTVQSKSIFHIKQIWENYYAREVLGLHLGCYVLDPELFARNYLTGTYRGGFWRKKPIPYIMTMFIQGDDINPEFRRDPEDPLWFWMGRHYYLHLALSLYDVKNRHFRVAHEGGVLKRLDLGLAFRHLDRTYNGYEEYFGSTRYQDNELFQQGWAFEKQLVQVHLAQTRDKLVSTMRGFNTLEEDDLIDFDPQLFCKELKIYWERTVPELQLEQGW